MEIEKIYKKHNYHPIQNIGLGATFFVMLPVLVFAIFLFSNESLTGGQSFLIISDLSKPDKLLDPINILPPVMTAITVVDALLRFRDDSSNQYKFYLIALVLLFLVYNLPSALMLYWIGNNLFSITFYQISLVDRYDLKSSSNALKALLPNVPVRSKDIESRKNSSISKAIPITLSSSIAEFSIAPATRFRCDSR